MAMLICTINAIANLHILSVHTASVCTYMYTVNANVFAHMSMRGCAGAAILCCGKAAASELQCLTAAPRLAVHQALSAPHKYLHTPYQISLSSKSDDACIAYQLFLEVTLHICGMLCTLHVQFLPWQVDVRRVHRTVAQNCVTS